MKGIILAGGAGSRLHPVTQVLSKQLMPIYDKPMIYYPLSILMLAGIRDILIITTPEDMALFKRLLKDGSQWGIRFSYVVQEKPEGLAHAFILGEEFIGDDSVTLILGDNIFWGTRFLEVLRCSTDKDRGATVFGYWVNDPERYGVVEFDKDGTVISIEEKPRNPKSNYAVTGVYCYDNSVVSIAKSIKPSARGELEITDVNRCYLEKELLKVELLGRGVAWLDTGTHDSLLQAAQFVETMQNRQGLVISSPEEIALRMGYINKKQVYELANKIGKNRYSTYLLSLTE